MTTASDIAHHAPGYRRGLGLVLLAGVFWSSMGLVVRLMEVAGPWQILFYRSACLTIFLFLVISLRSGGRPLVVYRKAGFSAVLGGLALVLAFGGSIFSVVNTTVANAMFLFATAPFFTALLGLVILGERVRRATWLAMAVAAVGVVVMVSEGIALGHLLGNVAAVLSALGFAFFTIALRWKRASDMLPAVSLGGLFTTIVAGVACWSGGQGFELPLRDIGLACFLGVFQLGVGLSLYTLGSKAVPAAELALLSMTEVVLGPVWVLLFLGESGALATWIGGAILMAAIAGNALTRLRDRPPPVVLP
ncbi:MAG: DMT family transporter [Pseudomonadota bacterium]